MNSTQLRNSERVTGPLREGGYVTNRERGQIIRKLAPRPISRARYTSRRRVNPRSNRGQRLLRKYHAQLDRSYPTTDPKREDRWRSLGLSLHLSV